MKKPVLVLLRLLVAANALSAGEVAADPSDAAMMQEAQQMVAAYHAGQPPATNRLRVVYFVPKDGEGHNHNSWAVWAEPKVER